jgi:hypothetical protein
MIYNNFIKSYKQYYIIIRGYSKSHTRLNSYLYLGSKKYALISGDPVAEYIYEPG